MLFHLPVSGKAPSPALNIAWSSMVSSWRDAEGVAIVAADALDIDSEKGSRIPVIIDGEEIAIGSHARAIYVPEASRCLIAKT